MEEITISLAESCQGTSRSITIPGTWIQGELRIPAGTLDGEVVSFTARSTRHHIRVKIEPDGVHQVQGRNLVREVHFRRREKPPGSEITLSTPHGTVKLEVDADMRTGTVWTVKGYGIPDPRGGPSGDLIATAVVEENQRPDPQPIRPANPSGNTASRKEYTVTIDREESLQGTYRTIAIGASGFERRIRIPAGTPDGTTITFVAQGVAYDARVQVKENAASYPNGTPSIPMPKSTPYREPPPTFQPIPESNDGHGWKWILGIAAGIGILVLAANSGAQFPGSETMRQAYEDTKQWITEGRDTSDADVPLITTEIEGWIIQLTNEERMKSGLPTLRHDPAISAIARAHSQQMTRHGMHHEIGGRDPTDRAMAAGYDCRAYLPNGSYTYGLGENIIEHPRVSLWLGDYGSMNPAKYNKTAREAATSMVKSWMDSPGHRRNILDQEYRRIGVGVATRISNDYGRPSETFFGTQNFSACP